MEFSSSCAALAEAAILTVLTTIRVVAECAEDPDYKTTGCIWPRRIYPVVSVIMKCYLSERISFKEYLDNFYSEFNEKYPVLLRSFH